MSNNDSNPTPVVSKIVRLRGFTVPVDGLKIGNAKTGRMYVNNHTGEAISTDVRLVAKLNGVSGVGLEIFEPEAGVRSPRSVVITAAEDLCVLIGVQPTKPWVRKSKPSPKPAKSVETAIMNYTIAHKSSRGSIMARVMVDCGEKGEAPIYLVSSTNEPIKAGTSVEVSHSHGNTFLVKPIDKQITDGFTSAQEIPSLLGVDVSRYAESRDHKVSVDKLATHYSARKGEKVRVVRTKK